MFNKDFFPTPTGVIEQMLMNVEVFDKIFLEPSAGKGNIVDYLNENGAKEVLTCEINKDLAKIVASKSKYITADFLSLRSEQISHVDIIIMNPPFSDEERHILHAWEIAPAGCTIISLCNASIFRAYNTKQAQIYELIKESGRKDNFGRCFSTSERQTDVEVGCIWLYKPRTEEDEFSDYFSIEDEPESLTGGLVKPNYVRDLVWRYVAAVRMFDEVMEVSSKINELTAPISKYGVKFGAYRSGETNYSDRKITRDEYKKELQKQCWEKVFRDLNMEKYSTKGVRDNINKFVETQEHIPFTVKNIYKMMEIIVGTHENRMSQVLIEAFDMICSFSAENSTAGEKWKTNSDYMINRKFIVPWMCEVSYGGELSIRYSGNRDKIDDLIRALCLLTATPYESIQSIYNFSFNMHNSSDNNRGDWERMKFGVWYDWGFFRIKGFKKGTMHFEFRDVKVWEAFNIGVAKARGWRLPKTSAETKTARKKGTGVEVY
ncbi:hypothetical protein M2451_002544 [Dysgonomonas sp. PFB1-18]|nr:MULTISPECIES: DUF4942 domain-containing protein [unclassified Dysgonomonas]MDH6381215.1 hypothetical protein [Dysgonomonas sp. PFB1-18]MDH6398427.1 hypothetical protein [Dysgonomonas sp. PF1-23]